MAPARRALAGTPLHSKRAVRKARNKLCGACVTPRAYYLRPCGTGRNYRPAARDDLREETTRSTKANALPVDLRATLQKEFVDFGQKISPVLAGVNFQ
jgi:hypothetical protein